MTDTSLLKAYITASNETSKSLAEYLGITEATFSKKMRNLNDYCFTQREIEQIGEKLNLSVKGALDIFFSQAFTQNGNYIFRNVQE